MSVMERLNGLVQGWKNRPKPNAVSKYRALLEVSATYAKEFEMHRQSSKGLEEFSEDYYNAREKFAYLEAKQATVQLELAKFLCTLPEAERAKYAVVFAGIEKVTLQDVHNAEQQLNDALNTHVRMYQGPSTAAAFGQMGLAYTVSDNIRAAEWRYVPDQQRFEGLNPDLREEAHNRVMERIIYADRRTAGMNPLRTVLAAQRIHEWRVQGVDISKQDISRADAEMDKLRDTYGDMHVLEMQMDGESLLLGEILRVEAEAGQER